METFWEKYERILVTSPTTRSYVLLQRGFTRLNLICFYENLYYYILVFSKEKVYLEPTVLMKYLATENSSDVVYYQMNVLLRTSD